LQREKIISSSCIRFSITTSRGGGGNFWLGIQAPSPRLVHFLPKRYAVIYNGQETEDYPVICSMPARLSSWPAWPDHHDVRWWHPTVWLLNIWECVCCSKCRVTEVARWFASWRLQQNADNTDVIWLLAIRPVLPSLACRLRHARTFLPPSNRTKKYMSFLDYRLWH